MARYLECFDVKPYLYINEGKIHGVTDYNIEKILADKVQTLIIVDSLDSDVDNYKKIYENNIQIVVADHHTVNPDIPYGDYVTLVSSDVDYSDDLCGCGVTWSICRKIDEKLGTNDALYLTDLVANATVADMVSLDENNMQNRAIVNYGLSKICNPALLRIGGNYEWNTKTIAFGVAPRVNSCNRLNKNEIPLYAFLSDDEVEIKKYAKLLDKCKEEQNIEVQRLYEEAIEQCSSQSEYKMLVVFTEPKYAINGVLANKLLEVYGKPILCLTKNGDAYGGSMRAIGVENFRQILEDTGLCEAHGHNSASGCVIKVKDFDLFRDKIEESLKDIEFVSETVVDAQIDAWDVDSTLLEEVKKIDRISGQGFPALKFLIEIDDFTVEKLSKGKHLGIRSANMLFIKWNFNDDELYERLEDAAMCGDTIKCIGSLEGSFVYKTFNKMILDDIIVN